MIIKLISCFILGFIVGYTLEYLKEKYEEFNKKH